MTIRSYSALGMLLPLIIIMAHGYSHALKTIDACWVYHVESVSKMGYSPFDFLFAIYGVACVQLAHSNLGDWKDIFMIHLIIIIKSEVSTFPIVVIFFRGCVSEMVVLPYSVIYYIYISGTLGLCFNYLCSVYWCSVYGICKRSDTLWPAGHVRLFVYYTISLSSLCRLIWRHWTNKMLVRCMLPSVCLRLRLFSQLSCLQYMGLCVFSLPNSPVMIVRMCTLSYYHHQIGSMNR